MIKKNKREIPYYSIKSDHKYIFARIGHFDALNIGVILPCLSIITLTFIGYLTAVSCLGLCTLILCGIRPLLNDN